MIKIMMFLEDVILFIIFFEVGFLEECVGFEFVVEKIKFI